MNFQKLNINDLQPADYNPRKDLQPDDKEYQKIMRSIKEFWICRSIIVNYDIVILSHTPTLGIN